MHAGLNEHVLCSSVLEISFPVRNLLLPMGAVKYKASRWSALSATLSKCMDIPVSDMQDGLYDNK